MIAKVREYSLPLIVGVIASLFWANLSPESYHAFLTSPLLGTNITLEFLVNDIFMVFFFATAGIEIVNSLSAGGALNPIRKAVVPLMAMIGGVMGPVLIFTILNGVVGLPEYAAGWGVCTATDIALAWLLAKIVFGAQHPAISFLLLLAVADDGVGLAIIAVFYPDPELPPQYIWLLLVVLAMGIAFLMKKKGIDAWPLYIFGPGVVSWIGMHNAHLHPALALVFIVPFLYRTKPEQSKLDYNEGWDIHSETYEPIVHLPIDRCEHSITPFVDFGLVFFGLANAGVQFSDISALTWIVLSSLILGKTLGVTVFTAIAVKLMKCSLPDNMNAKDVVVAGLIAGLGLTVALFIAGNAFTDLSLQSAAKMGALFTVASFILAPVAGKLLKIKRIT
ncbi:MAG: Na+/H+ antiporter NhaA [Clostridiales Family XIII bacterium]|jgi:NhaA family Na+:H+ antiporter|nr:Na+/H+ antiporter NhaA [Clostridiales Family XIII bacterium]